MGIRPLCPFEISEVSEVVNVGDRLRVYHLYDPDCDSEGRFIRVKGVQFLDDKGNELRRRTYSPRFFWK